MNEKRSVKRSTHPEAVEAQVGRDAVCVELSDGRMLSFPLAWSPRLLYAESEEREIVEVYPGGMHWPLLDEDLSVAGLLAGVPSQESGESLERWKALMDRRRAQRAADGGIEPHAPVRALPDWWHADTAI